MTPAIVAKRYDRRTESAKTFVSDLCWRTCYSTSASLCLLPIEFFSTCNVMPCIRHDDMWGI